MKIFTGNNCYATCEEGPSSMCEMHRLRSDCADAQSDLNLCISYILFLEVGEFYQANCVGLNLSAGMRRPVLE